MYPQHSAEMQAWIAWCRPSFSGVASFLSKQGTLEPHEGQLRVLIEQRTGEVRNMLQLDELLSQCNAAQSLVSNSQYSCRPFTFGGDLKRCLLSLLPCFACQSCSSDVAWTEPFRGPESMPGEATSPLQQVPERNAGAMRLADALHACRHCKCHTCSSDLSCTELSVALRACLAKQQATLMQSNQKVWCAAP